MTRNFKTPSRRRLKKWRSRVEKLAYSNMAQRGFAQWFGELLNCLPMIDAAKRVGVDLLDNLPKPIQLADHQVRAMLCQMILGREYGSFFDSTLGEEWPTRKNLEV